MNSLLSKSGKIKHITLILVSVFAGVQLFCMGVMGSYLAKIYQESKHRPHYIVGKTNIDDVVKK